MARTLKLIESKLCDGVTSISFTSIPQTYTDLYIECYTNTGNNMFMRLNDDSGANYNVLQGYGTGSVFDNATNAGGSSFQLIGLVNSQQNSTMFATHRIHIMEYAVTGNTKAPIWDFGYYINSTATHNVGTAVGRWTGSTNPITTLTFLTQGGNFTSNSRITLYGILAGNA